MVDYEVKIGEDFYFPKTERWIMDCLGLKLDYAIYYQMIINKGYVVWSREWTAYVLGCSEEKVKNMQTALVEKGLLIKRTINTVEGGGKRRTVYVARYTRNGERSKSEIEYLLSCGLEKIAVDYQEKRYYKKHN